MNEQETWKVMSEIQSFVKKYGCKTFKDSLLEFDKDTYELIFFPQTISEKCFLTNKQ